MGDQTPFLNQSKIDLSTHVWFLFNSMYVILFWVKFFLSYERVSTSCSRHRVHQPIQNQCRLFHVAQRRLRVSWKEQYERNTVYSKEFWENQSFKSNRKLTLFSLEKWTCRWRLCLSTSQKRVTFYLSMNVCPLASRHLYRIVFCPFCLNTILFFLTRSMEPGSSRKYHLSLISRGELQFDLVSIVSWRWRNIMQFNM